MPLIAFLAPDEDMLATARATLAKTHPDVLLEQGLLSAGVRKARTLAREGVEIVITRGGTAVAINEARLGLTVVEVPITGLDMIRALEEARHYGRRIAVIAFPSMIMGIDCLGPILDIDLRCYPIHSEFKAEANVHQGLPGGGRGRHRRRHHRAGRPAAQTSLRDDPQRRRGDHPGYPRSEAHRRGQTPRKGQKHLVPDSPGLRLRRDHLHRSGPPGRHLQSGGGKDHPNRRQTGDRHERSRIPCPN